MKAKLGWCRFRSIRGTGNLGLYRLESADEEGRDIQSRFFKVVNSCCVGPSGFGV
jgi:hypothetical protein